jgi:hypothetical protein
MLQAYTSKMVKRGWVVTAQSGDSVQLKRPKRFNAALLIIGLLTIPLAGLGFIVLLFALVDFLVKKEHTLFVTTKELETTGEPAIPSDWSGPMLMFGLLIGSLLACILVTLAFGWLL